MTRQRRERRVAMMIPATTRAKRHLSKASIVPEDKK